MSSLLRLVGSPHFHALCLILASTAAIQALVAIWAATSRTHWFYRAVAVWASVTALLPIRAWPPALLFAFSSPLTILLIRVTSAPRANALLPASATAVAHQKSPLHFSIRDLLLAMILVGLCLVSVMELVPQLRRINFAELAVDAAAQTLIPYFAWASWAWRRRRLALLLLVASVAAFTCGAYFLWRRLGSDWSLLGVLYESAWTRLHGTFLGTVVPACELVLFLWAAIALARASSLPEAPSAFYRAGRSTRIILSLTAAAWIIVLGLLYWQMLGRLPLPPPFSTAPTNHGRLMEISRQVKGLQGATLPAAAAQRQQLLDETVILVQSENYVPYHPLSDASADGWNAFVMPAQLVRDLARALDADCGVAISTGDYDLACELAIANVRLGLLLKRGSTLVEFLIGTAVQGLTAKRLIACRAELPADQARRLMTELEKSLAEEENFAAIEYRDRAMAERAYGWAARLSNILDFAGILSEVHVARVWVEPKLRSETTTRLLQVDLAIRLYQRERGHPPASLDELVPAYLPALPRDAYTHKPFVYRRAANDLLLYSVGHDGTDDGGKFTNMTNYYSRDYLGRLARGYDYDLDTTTRR